MVLALSFAGAAGAQVDVPTMEFHLERPGLAVPDYRFLLYDVKDGGTLGTYTAENAPVANRYGPTTGGLNETVQRLTVQSGLIDRMFRQVRSVQELGTCNSRRKGIADTGRKTLSFHERGKEATVCQFNYTENTLIQELTQDFQAMAATLDLGRKMDRDQRFDRLALDADMTILVGAVKNGQAMGMVWIRSTLQGLVDDPAVLERVRTQAARLLEQSMGER